MLKDSCMILLEIRKYHIKDLHAWWLFFGGSAFTNFRLKTDLKQ